MIRPKRHTAASNMRFAASVYRFSGVRLLAIS